MNNNFVIIAIIGVFIVGAISANPIVEAVKPLTEIIIANDSSNPIPVTSNPTCPDENIKIISSYSFLTNPEIEHATEPTTHGGVVHIADDLDKVLTSEQESIIDRLNDLGYFVDDGSPRDLILDDLANHLLFQHNVICIES